MCAALSWAIIAVSSVERCCLETESSEFCHMSAYSSQFCHMSAYSSEFCHMSAYSSEFCHMSAYSSEFCHMSAYSFLSDIFCQILTKFGVFRHICVEVSSIRFHLNPSSGSRIATCGQTDGRA